MKDEIKFYLEEIRDAAIVINGLGETAGFTITPVYDGEAMALAGTIDRIEITQACLRTAQGVLAKFDEAYFEKLTAMIKAEHE